MEHSVPKNMTIRIVRGSDDILIQCPITKEFIEATKLYLDGLKDELNHDERTYPKERSLLAINLDEVV